MSKTLLRNPSSNPLPLPFPFRGIVPAGGGVVVDAPIATVRSAFGGATRLGGIELSEVDATPADAFYLGNLLDPVATQAGVTASIAANSALARPGKVTLTGQDGLSSPNMVLLAAPHTPGAYLWHTSVRKSVGASAGTLTCTLNHTDPSAGAQQLARGSFSMVGTGGFSISALCFESDGSTALNVDNAFAGVTGGTLVARITHAVALAG